MSQNNTLQAFWVAMGTFSTIALSFLSAAVLSRYFDKIEYGSYKQILYVYTSLNVVFTAGLPKVFAYFLPQYNISEGKEIVQKITRILFFLGLIFSLALFCSANIISEILNNPKLAKGLRIFSVVPVLLFPTLGLHGIFATYKKTIFIAVYDTISKILMLVCILVPIVFYGGGYIDAIYGWIMASTLSLILALYFKSIPFANVKIQVSGLQYKQIFTYSFPIVGAALGGMLIRSADQFFISRYFGTEVFAEFSNGFVPLPFVGMVTGAASAVLMPVFSKLNQDKANIAEVTSLWRSTLIKSALIIFPLLIFFFFQAEEIIILLYSEIYRSSTIYFQIFLVSNFFNIIIFAPLLLSLGRSSFYANVHFVFAALSWVLMYLIVYSLDSPVAVAVCSRVLNVIMIFSFLSYSAKQLELKISNLIPFKILLLIVLHSFVIGLITELPILKISDIVFIDLVFRGIFFGLLLTLTGKFFKLDYLITLKPLLNRVSCFLKK